MKKKAVFRAATAGLGKYHTAAMAGLGSIGLKSYMYKIYITCIP